jgi:hypothetical protein
MIEVPAAAVMIDRFLRALRLRVHRHQRPDPVHAGDRPCRRGSGPPLRPLASGRAAALSHTISAANRGPLGLRVRRDGRRSGLHRVAAGHGPAQLLDAPGAHLDHQAAGAACRHAACLSGVLPQSSGMRTIPCSCMVLGAPQRGRAESVDLRALVAKPRKACAIVTGFADGTAPQKAQPTAGQRRSRKDQVLDSGLKTCQNRGLR